MTDKQRIYKGKHKYRLFKRTVHETGKRGWDYAEDFGYEIFTYYELCGKLFETKEDALSEIRSYDPAIK